MEGFTYVDIFATKGVEYLLVIGALLLFIPFWRMVSRPGRSDMRRRKASSRRSANGFIFRRRRSITTRDIAGRCRRAATWYRVGIDDFAQKLVGRIDADTASAGRFPGDPG